MSQSHDFRLKAVEIKFDSIIAAEEQGLLRTKALFPVSSERTHEDIRREVSHFVELEDARSNASIEGLSSPERGRAYREHLRMAASQPGQDLAVWRKQFREAASET